MAAGPPPAVTTFPVSVIIPAYNRASLLPRAIASVRAQTRPPAEIIVVDDGSSDNTADVAQRLEVRLIAHGENRGAAAARNTALRHSRHDWFALLDSDDEWLPNHLETLWQLRGPHVWVAGSAVVQDGSNLVVKERRARLLKGPGSLVFPYNTVPASAVLARTDVALGIGGYREDLRFAEDWDLWLRMLEIGTGLQVATPILRYHRHGSQKSKSDDPLTRKSRAQAQDTIIADGVSRGTIPRRLARMRGGVIAWDEARAGLRSRDRHRTLGAARALLDPVAVVGAGWLLAHRAVVRRRAHRVGVDGRPSVGVFDGSPWSAPERIQKRGVVRLPSGPLGVASAVVRPPGLVVARRSRTRFALRIAQVRTVAPAALDELLSESSPCETRLPEAAARAHPTSGR